MCMVGLLFAGLISYARALWFRTQSERLFDSVKTLQVGVSDFAVAKRLADRYANHVTVDSNQCTPSDCRFYIRFLKPHLLYVGNCCNTDISLPRRLGVRPSIVVASVSVRDGLVRYASFRVSYRTSNGHWLEAYSKAISSFGLLDKALNLGLQLHPNYAVKTGNITTIGDGAFIVAAYTPQASANEQSIVNDINFSCLTRVPDCRNLSDLMPQAASAFVLDGRWIETNSSMLGTVRTQFYEQLQQKYGSSPWNDATSF